MQWNISTISTCSQIKEGAFITCIFRSVSYVNGVLPQRPDQLQKLLHNLTRWQDIVIQHRGEIHLCTVSTHKNFHDLCEVVYAHT